MKLMSIDNIVYTFREFKYKIRFGASYKNSDGTTSKATVAIFVSNWKQINPSAYENNLYNLNNNLKLFTANQVPYVYRIFFRAIVPAWTEVEDVVNGEISTKPWKKLAAFYPSTITNIEEQCRRMFLGLFTDLSYKQEYLQNNQRSYYISQVKKDCYLDEYPTESLVSEEGHNLFKEDFAQSLFGWPEVYDSTNRSKNINLTGTDYKAYATLFPSKSNYSSSSIGTDVANYSLAMDNGNNHSIISSVRVDGGYKAVPIEAPVNILIYNPVSDLTNEAVSAVTPYTNFFYSEGKYSQAYNYDGSIIQYFVAPVPKVEVG